MQGVESGYLLCLQLSDLAPAPTTYAPAPSLAPTNAAPAPLTVSPAVSPVLLLLLLHLTITRDNKTNIWLFCAKEMEALTKLETTLIKDSPENQAISNTQFP